MSCVANMFFEWLVLMEWTVMLLHIVLLKFNFHRNIKSCEFDFSFISDLITQKTRLGRDNVCSSASSWDLDTTISVTTVKEKEHNYIT